MLAGYYVVSYHVSAIRSSDLYILLYSRTIWLDLGLHLDGHQKKHNILYSVTNFFYFIFQSHLVGTQQEHTMELHSNVILYNL